MKIENKNLLPVITSENDVYPYLKKINQFPILTDEEEKKPTPASPCKKWDENTFLEET